MPAQSSNWIARANIRPSKFVKQDGSDHGVVECGADEEAVGISHEGTREAPIEGIVPMTAKEGESAQVYTEGWPCEIVAGAPVTAGQKLKSDANGDAIPATTANELYNAYARASAATGERIKATVQRGRV